MSMSVVAIVMVAGLVVLSFWFLSRRHFTKRTPARLEDIYRGGADGISFETFSEVFNAVGDAYSVDPRLLRPEDSLASLMHMDSWVLDAGTEKLNRWLVSKGVREIAAQPTTISELLKLIETNRK